MTPKLRTFLALAFPLVLADCATKHLAVAELQPGLPQEVLGEWFRLTLVFNRDAAMGLTLGLWSRWGFAAIALAAVAVLIGVLKRTRPTDRLRAAALALVAAGAIGNLIDRIRWNRGVVDFIDVGIGIHRFWMFNLADAAVTVGAVFLTLLLWQEGNRVSQQRVGLPEVQV